MTNPSVTKDGAIAAISSKLFFPVSRDEMPQSGLLDPDDFSGCVRDEVSFGLVKHHDKVAKRIANDGAAANLDVKGAGDGLAAGLVEAFKRVINIGHQKVHFRTKVSAKDKLCIRFRHPQPSCFRRPPKKAMAKRFGVEPQGHIQIVDLEHQAIDFSE